MWFKKGILITLLFASFQSYGQLNVFVDGQIGLGFQSKLMIDNKELGASVLSGRLGAGIDIPIKEKIGIETGIYAMHSRKTYEFEGYRMNIQKLKLQIPLLVRYQLQERIKIGAGFSVQNERDFEDMNIDQGDIFRLNAMIQGVYQLNEKWHLMALGQFALEETADVYALAAPKNYLQFGVRFMIINPKKEVKNEK
ncbi:MAG: hypothetical protein N4A45_13755 [Flavobacteriales bacterium]|jgi:hypothetical protein|nr:hypothetical protein [Flavobacteriales bacterium]